MDEMMMAMMMGDMSMGSKSKSKKGGGDGMDDMMMSMMMDEMGLGGQSKGKSGKAGKKGGQDLDDMDKFFMGMMMGDSAKQGGAPDMGLGSDDSYDSDEINAMGRDMGLSKKELAAFKKDFQAELTQKKKGSKADKRKKPKPKQPSREDSWES